MILTNLRNCAVGIFSDHLSSNGAFVLLGHFVHALDSGRGGGGSRGRDLTILQRSLTCICGSSCSAWNRCIWCCRSVSFSRLCISSEAGIVLRRFLVDRSIGRAEGTRPHPMSPAAVSMEWLVQRKVSHDWSTIRSSRLQPMTKYDPRFMTHDL